MEERLVRLEQALEELRAENRQLRADLEELRSRLSAEETEEDEASASVASAASQARRRFWTRWYVVALAVFVIALPVVLMTLGHMKPIWSTLIGFGNALLVYFIGPGAIRLLAEGLLRAIPGVVLGQTTRIAVDSVRNKKKAR